MWPYWVMFLSVALPSMFRVRLVPRQAWWFFWVIVVSHGLFIGLRHEVGGDWWSYEADFYRVSQLPLSSLLIEAKDPGYSVVGWVVSRIGGGIHTLNLICALVLVLGAGSLAIRQPRPTLALLVAVPYLYIVVGMGYTRQAAAIGLAMLGLVALGDRRQRAFVVWIVVAATFHKSAVLLLPIAALAATRNRIWSYLWIGVITIVGTLLFVADSADSLLANYVYSDYADASQGAPLRVAMNSIPAVLMLIFRNRLFEDAGARKLWSWVAFLALLCIPMLTISATATDRIALYFIPLQLVVFSRLPLLSSAVYSRALIIGAVVLYYACVQFVWLKYASNADSWIPYRLMPIW